MFREDLAPTYDPTNGAAPIALVPDPPALAIQGRIESDSATLRVRGEVDLASGSLLERDLFDIERFRPARIVLDLAALEFIDCSGIGALLRAQARAKRCGRELVLTNVPVQALNLMSLTGADAQLAFE